MGTRCETAGKYVLPVFKSLIARELVYTHHLTQEKAAQKLSLTQVAISQYISSKRAASSSKKCGELLPKLQELADVAAKRLANEEASWKEVSLDFCKRCSRCFVDEVDQSSQITTIT